MTTGTVAGELRPPSAGIAARQGIVVVKISPAHTEFYVHRALLVHHSEYFRKALSGEWKEAQENTVTMEDIEIDVFALFIHWLYHQSLPKGHDAWKDVLSHNPNVPNSSCEAAEHDMRKRVAFDCIKAYSFSLRIVADAYGRAVNSSFNDLMRRTYFFDAAGYEAVAYAFEYIPEDKIMLQRLVDEFCGDFDLCKSDFCADSISLLPASFVRRVMIRLQKKDTVYTSHRCYEEHNTDEDRKDCKLAHLSFDEDLDSTLP